MTYSRRARRLRALRLASFEDYCAKPESGDPAEVIEFINAITTNLITFFRETHHFEHLAQKMIPELMRQHASDRRVRTRVSTWSGPPRTRL